MSVHRILPPFLAALLLLGAALPAPAPAQDDDDDLDALRLDLPAPAPKPAPDPFAPAPFASDPFALPAPALTPPAVTHPRADLLDRYRQAPRMETFPPDTRAGDRLLSALAELKKELAQAESRGDTAGQARILGNMGTLYMLMGRDAESLEALYRGAALQQMLGNAEKLAELQILIDTVAARQAGR